MIHFIVGGYWNFYTFPAAVPQIKFVEPQRGESGETRLHALYSHDSLIITDGLHGVFSVMAHVFSTWTRATNPSLF